MKNVWIGSKPQSENNFKIRWKFEEQNLNYSTWLRGQKLKNKRITNNSNFFPPKFPFPKYKRKIWRKKNLLCKEGYSFIFGLLASQSNLCKWTRSKNKRYFYSFLRLWVIIFRSISGQLKRKDKNRIFLDGHID